MRLPVGSSQLSSSLETFAALIKLVSPGMFSLVGVCVCGDSLDLARCIRVLGHLLPDAFPYVFDHRTRQFSQFYMMRRNVLFTREMGGRGRG